MDTSKSLLELLCEQLLLHYHLDSKIDYGNTKFLILYDKISKKEVSRVSIQSLIRVIGELAFYHSLDVTINSITEMIYNGWDGNGITIKKNIDDNSMSYSYKKKYYI